MTARRLRHAIAVLGLVGCSSTPPSGLDERPRNETCLAPPRPPVDAPVVFERVFADVSLDTPLVIAQPPGDRSRWFAALRAGQIVSFPIDGSSPPRVVADVGTLAGLPVNVDGEGGLLGLAFHPDFATNGRAYVSWTTIGGPVSNMRSVVSEITSTDGGTSFTAHRVILGPFDQPAYNHNGGTAAFGPDGELYLSFGDGGYPDPGQSRDGVLSKIVHIDVDGGGSPEVFAYGFRNPFRFSFDRATGDLWAADVGQAAYEEVNKVARGGNYGWPCREGAHDLAPATEGCDATPLLDPIAEHAHASPHTRSITGGVVYRGAEIPDMVGTYVYGDFKTQELFALAFDAETGTYAPQVIDGAPPAPWVAFAEDADGELYALAISGEIYRMKRNATAPTSALPARLSETGCVLPEDPTTPSPGMLPYRVNAPLWSDGTEKERYFAIPDGTTITQVDQDLDLPIGSVVMKTFAFEGRNIETRLLVRHDDGGWAGYSYEWSDDQRDAFLLPASKRVALDGFAWTFPSRGDCGRCHTEAAGRTLGLELGQLASELTYPATGRRANQLVTLDRIGMFSAPLEIGLESVVFPEPGSTAPLGERARAYLHANCSGCHRPNGGGRGDLDLRYTRSLRSTCDVVPDGGTLDIPGAKLLVPGHPERSLVAVRMRLRSANRMPPLATDAVDEEGLALVESWIRSLDDCP